MLGIYPAVGGKGAREARPPVAEILIEPAGGGVFPWQELRRRGELCVLRAERRLICDPEQMARQQPVEDVSGLFGVRSSLSGSIEVLSTPHG